MKRIHAESAVPGVDTKSGDKPRFRLGIDIGSTSSDVVVLDPTGEVIAADYRRTLGKPAETLLEQLQKLFKDYSSTLFTHAAVTGSAGRLIAEQMQLPYINEVQAQAKGIAHLYPQYPRLTIIEMGGQDSKLIFLEERGQGLELKSFALNSACAAGTGSFLDQQAQRLGISIEDEFGRLALKCQTVPRMAGRCSVFAKSDMIHLQQVATPLSDILAGLCMALACSLKSGLGSGMQFVRPVIFTGGVAANAGVVRAFEDVLGLAAGELIVPQLHFYTGALGGIYASYNKQLDDGGLGQAFNRLQSHLEQNQNQLTQIARRSPLKTPSLAAPLSIVHDHLLAGTETIDAYLGVDVGSISTNVVVIDAKHRVLSKAYLMTAGRPIEAVQQGLRLVGQNVSEKVRIAGAATTGSGRYLTGDFIGADIVINEITAQAAGAVAVCPEVDTIFEIGGQDSKYIRLDNGVVTDFEMNHACAAGTGSFLEEQAQRLGISIKNEFSSLAMQSKKPVHLGERCTVFIESDLLGCQQRGAVTEDLVAGLAYSIAANYINRVVGRRKIGNNICFQGGTAFNTAVWAAFEKVTGRRIRVPDHHEMTGAIGAAIISHEHVSRLKNNGQPGYQCRFKGFENLIEAKYTVETFSCAECSNHCEIKRVQIEGSVPLFYGSRCDRYNVKTQNEKHVQADLLAWRTQKLFECSGLCQSGSKAASSTKPVVGIPQALIAWQQLPVLSQFLQTLGFDILLSGKTDRTIIRQGIESIPSSPCFPVKAAFGHVRKLLDKQPDFLFIPFIVDLPSLSKENRSSKLCPYVQSFADQVKSVFAGQMGHTKLITEPLYLGRGKRAITRSFSAMANQFNIKDVRLIKKAIAAGLEAQTSFDMQTAQKGQDIISSLKPDEKLFVLISRPYNGLDEGMNLRLCQKLDAMNIRWIPMEMLDLANAEFGDLSLHKKVYWNYGQKILRAAEIIRRDNRFFAIYLSNFSCGPDSFLQHFFDEIMRPKPALVIEIDEHSADAGLITRLEAFFESLRHYKPLEQKVAKRSKQPKNTLDPDSKLYIPYMSDAAHGMAACFRAYGRPAQVMKIADESVLNRGRQVTNGKECLPCAITAGEMLNVLRTDTNNNAAFLMPDGDGPCRFGMYNCLHRQILGHASGRDVSVLAPSQDNGFAKQFAAGHRITAAGMLKNLWKSTVAIDLLHKVLLKIRPYSPQPQLTDALYGDILLEWCQLVEKRGSISDMVRFMDEAAERLAAFLPERKPLKPVIGIVGEIYVRNHPFSNGNLIHRLEALGAACELASAAEWVYYTNYLNINNAMSRGNYIRAFKAIVMNRIQHNIEHTLAAPLEKRFGPLAECNTEKIIGLARPYVNPAFEGEAVLTIGKTIEFHHSGISGVVNVMPFTCMPSTIVTTHTPRVSRDCGQMPILNLSFDGQHDPALTTRLEAFVDQIQRVQHTHAAAPV